MSPEGFHPSIEEQIATAPSPEKTIRPDLLEKLEAGIEAITDSESFKEYLESQAQFWTYSFGNVLLIKSQAPYATKVNSFDRWKNLGRFPKKGTGIKILYPMFRPNPESLKDPTQPAKILYSFGIGNVFDVSDTYGKPLPERPHTAELEGSEGTGLLVDLLGVAESEGLTVENMPTEKLGTMDGFYVRSRKLIVVKEASPTQMALTLAHETAHHFGGDDRHEVDRPHEETMAEAAAWIVCHENGLDTSANSFPYVATWAKDKATLKRAMDRIQKVSKAMLQKLEVVRQSAYSELSVAPAEMGPQVGAAESDPYSSRFLPYS